jgi:hypothetical protein
MGLSITTHQPFSICAATGFSCSTASSSKIRFDPSQELGESERTEPDCSSGDTHTREVRYSNTTEDSGEAREEELCKMSLLVHILLVPDVSHLQCKGGII